ncbi:MAG: transcriptional regulator [Planctomycetales bacterium]
MASSKKPSSEAGRFAYEGLERVIHEKARLGIMTSLVTQPDGILFSDLKQLCSLTDGNLNRHLKVLQESGLVDAEKTLQSNRHQTVCSITAVGRRRLTDYVAELERVVRDADQAALGARKKSKPRGYQKGLSPA